ncbi:MAG: hypothetical protein FGM55_08835 [Rhodoferax sp.]|nr:hypothetical protein [Rhodoferax sp.]
MNDLVQILNRSRLALGVLLVGAVMAAAVLITGDAMTRKAAAELAQARQQDEAVSSQLTARRADLELMTRQHTRFESLRTGGMVGKPNREIWTEELVEVYKSAGLPDGFTFVLQSPKPYSPSVSTPESGQTPAPPGSTGSVSDGATMHDLEFTTSQVHESEMLDFLKRYQARASGRYRVSACNFSSAGEKGLTARCSLRFFVVPGETLEVKKP